jgi:hypothetical protein
MTGVRDRPFSMTGGNLSAIETQNVCLSVLSSKRNGSALRLGERQEGGLLYSSE